MNKSQGMTEDPSLRTHLEGFLILLALSSLFSSFFFFLAQLSPIPTKCEQVFFKTHQELFCTDQELRLDANGADKISVKIRLGSCISSRDGRWLIDCSWRCTTLSMANVTPKADELQQSRSSCFKNMSMSCCFISWCEGWSPHLNSLPEARVRQQSLENLLWRPREREGEKFSQGNCLCQRSPQIIAS